MKITADRIREILKERILILDGGLGTMVQGYRPDEAAFRGERFRDHGKPLTGCNDVLALTAPQMISRIHEAYLVAGADIISTDTFNANVFSLADYGLEDYSYEICKAGAEVARAKADEFTASEPHKPRFVAGSVGPTGKTASMSSDVSDPGARDVTFDRLAEAYSIQIKGLLDGGADIILFETIFDTLNVKAAIFALRAESDARGYEIPLMLSVTLADASGRTLSGQTIGAFYASVEHSNPVSIGINCAFGARQIMPYLEELSDLSEFYVSAHPNAGLPNIEGGYDETPEDMAAIIGTFMDRGLINIIGGCCGTTPVHISAIARQARSREPRQLPGKKNITRLSGLELLNVTRQNNFINIGERTNVAGSAKFARLIREENYEEALSIARQQVEAGAQVVDVCMDDGLIDGPKAMTRFLNLAMAEPEIARVPFMIDSSSWETIEAGLKCVQGKCIVNSISLKEGEAEFLRKARLADSYGAAVTVMLFDETGQADVYERKIEIARRAYDLLVADGVRPQNIIFDPNVLSVATGIEEHNRYGLDFIRAVEWIKNNLPHAKVSGGVSNLSFSFRGNNLVREAMHTAFLYHAIGAGMDMGIVNPAMIQVYSDVEPRLLKLVEDVVLARNEDAPAALMEYAQNNNPGKSVKTDDNKDRWRELPIDERIAHSLLKGITTHIEEDILEAYNTCGTALDVINDYLMPAMERIGDLFGAGKMFLPQVVKSARVMQSAVAVLQPYMESTSDGHDDGAGKVLIATVKGDVHDIGKNIVSVVMSCNGYKVNDLGVMVDAVTIADEAQRWKPDAIGLSGLISPSLEEMINVVKELGRRGLSIPVIIGGATTSDIHTAVKIAPAYEGVVVRSRDASSNINILNKLIAGDKQYIGNLLFEQEKLRTQFRINSEARRLVHIGKARQRRRIKTPAQIIRPSQTAHVLFRDYALSEVIPLIDWSFFFAAWELRGKYPDILDSDKYGSQARKLHTDALEMLERIAAEGLLRLNGTAGIYPAFSDGDDIILQKTETEEVRLPQLRNQEADARENLSLADYVVPGTEYRPDYVCAFAVTSGVGLRESIGKFRSDGDQYSAIMLKLLADRLAEAFAEKIHQFVRRSLWGFETGEEPSVDQLLTGDYQGVRVAFGYPACPDHSLKKEVLGLLDPEGVTGMTLTENYMIDPAESVCGLIFAGEDDKVFTVGRIDSSQLEDYAARRGMTVEELKKIIPHNL